MNAHDRQTRSPRAAAALAPLLLLLFGMILSVPAAGQIQEAGPDSLAGDFLPPDPVLVQELDTWTTGVNATGTVLMTPLFPGWGQLYTDNSWRASLAFGLEMFYWSNLLMRDRRATRANEFAQTFPEGSSNRDLYGAVAEENWEQMRDFAWWSGGILLIIALDAYVGAHLFHFDEDPVPVPNRWEGIFGQPGTELPGSGLAPQLTVFQWRKSF